MPYSESPKKPKNISDDDVFVSKRSEQSSPDRDQYGQVVQAMHEMFKQDPEKWKLVV